MSNADVMRAYQRLDKRLAEARRKSKLLAFVAFGVMSLSAQRAQAVDLDMRQDPIEAPHPITGTKGIWLDYDLARDVLADVERLEAMRREVAELRAALEMRRGESKALEDAVTLAEATARASAADAVRSMAIAENERRRARVWWRRPSLWFGLGTVVGAGCVTALAVGVR